LSDFYLSRIRRGIAFVESHLDEDMPLAQVAQAAGLSQWHFQRMFKSLTGDTLKSYIRARRMAAALERLRTTELRVADIAVLAGFASQEAFARAFKQAFDISPTTYREVGTGSLVVEKLPLDAAMLRHVHDRVSLEPRITGQPRMTLVGLRTCFYGVDSDKNDLGAKLPPLWAAFLPRRGEIEGARAEVCYGVVRQQREDSDRLEYFAAVEVSAPGSLPPGMVTVEIPAATYARFEHRGPAAEVDRTVSYAYATWLMRSGRRHSYGPDLEIYDARYHPTDDGSVFEYAIPLAEREE
jgi:AraC-like DNA-binding protein/predicted transcriptional regulator YdeE